MIKWGISSSIARVRLPKSNPQARLLLNLIGFSDRIDAQSPFMQEKPHKELILTSSACDDLDSVSEEFRRKAISSVTAYQLYLL